MTFKKGLIYVFLIIFAIFSLMLNKLNLLTYYNNLIFPLFWILISLLSLFLGLHQTQKVKSKSEKIESLLIIVILYILFYSFLGLIFTYGKNPLNRSLEGVVFNTWIYLIPAFFQEVLRENLVKRKTSPLNCFLIIFLFSIININWLNIDVIFANNELLVKFILNTVLMTIANQTFLTYLTKTGGLKLSLAYRIPLLMMTLFFPVLPNLDPFINSIANLFLIIVLFIYLNRIEQKKDFHKIKRSASKKDFNKTLNLLVIFLILSAFIIKVFIYFPLSIISNSMLPVIKRGDVVISQKLKSKDLKDLKVGDIIQYQIKNYFVIHRIIKIEKTNGELFFITKGDNNEFPDQKKVKENQVIGLIKFKIPIIGYPAIWLNDIIKDSTKVEVET